MDLCVTEKLVLDSLAAWIAEHAQSGLMNRRNRTLLPVIKERTQIDDALARHLAMLGLERLERPTETPESIVAEIVAKRPNGVQDFIEGPQRLQDRRGAADPTETPPQPESAPARPSSVNGYVAPGAPEPVTVRPDREVVPHVEVPEF